MSLTTLKQVEALMAYVCNNAEVCDRDFATCVSARAVLTHLDGIHSTLLKEIEQQGLDDAQE